MSKLAKYAYKLKYATTNAQRSMYLSKIREHNSVQRGGDSTEKITEKIIENLRTIRTDIDTFLKTIGNQFDAKRAELEDIKKQLLTVNTELEKCTSQLALLTNDQSKSTELEKKITDLTFKNQELTQQNEKITGQLAAITQQLTECNEKYEKLNIGKTREQQTIDQVETQKAELKNKYDQLQRDLNECVAEKTTVTRTMTQYREELEALKAVANTQVTDNSKINELSSQIETLTNQKAELIAQLERVAKEVIELRTNSTEQFRIFIDSSSK